MPTLDQAVRYTRPASLLSTETLPSLREKIADLDRSIFECFQRRMELAERVGRIKMSRGEPVFVPEVHEQVLARARSRAAACGVSEQVMVAMYSAMMQGSIERQHQVHREAIRASPTWTAIPNSEQGQVEEDA